jgi:hypothetical protein
MSSAGHIMNMINTIKQNRAMQKERRDNYKRSDKSTPKSSNQNYHVPSTPRERIRQGGFEKTLNAVIFILLMGLILLCLYLFFV